MKTLKIITEVEVEDDVNPQYVIDWLSAGHDNLPYEELDSVEYELSEKVSVGISYLDSVFEESE